MVIIPHPPYLPDLAPCDFALSPKFKMKLKGRCFETVSDIQREFQVTALRKMTSTVVLKRGKNDGIVVYVPKETILKEMAPKLSKLSQYFFFDLVWELSDTPLMNFNDQSE
jgi:hypothetical protein